MIKTKKISKTANKIEKLIYTYDYEYLNMVISINIVHKKGDKKW